MWTIKAPIDIIIVGSDSELFNNLPRQCGKNVNIGLSSELQEADAQWLFDSKRSIFIAL